MTFRRLKYVYHDALIVNYEIGPSNELSLNVVLMPYLNPNSPNSLNEVSIKFGKIQNFDDVVSFFAEVSNSSESKFFPDKIEIVNFVYEHKFKWILSLQEHGAITIHSFKCTES